MILLSLWHLMKSPYNDTHVIFYQVFTFTLDCVYKHTHQNGCFNIIFEHLLKKTRKITRILSEIRLSVCVLQVCSCTETIYHSAPVPHWFLFCSIWRLKGLKPLDWTLKLWTWGRTTGPIIPIGDYPDSNTLSAQVRPTSSPCGSGPTWCCCLCIVLGGSDDR